MSDDEQTFSEHRKLLFASAYRLLGSAADAEDVVQDAWFKWSGADRGQVSDPKAYLARIVSNVAMDRLRSTRRQRETYVAQVDFALRDHVPNEFVRVNPLGLEIGYFRLDQAFEESRR